MSVSISICKDYEQLEIDSAELDSLLEKEWLLSNNRGSYASGTVIGWGLLGKIVNFIMPIKF